MPKGDRPEMKAEMPNWNPVPPTPPPLAISWAQRANVRAVSQRLLYGHGQESFTFFRQGLVYPD